MNEKKVVKVILADDHPMFLDGLTELLKKEKEIEIVGLAVNGNEVMDILENKPADLIITDVNMPELDGVELTRKLKKSYPEIKILALTMHGSENTISTLLKLGVDGYILKEADIEELLSAIHTIINDEQYFSPEVQKAVMEGMMPDTGKKHQQDFIPKLSEREIEVLHLISQEFTQEEIAEKLFISSHTVVYHKRKLMIHFDVKSVAGLIRKAAEKGLLK